MELELSWFREQGGAFQGELRFDEPLSRHTYYRIGGLAPILAIPRSLADLRWLRQGVDRTGVDWFVLGLGSNLLVSDSGYRGLIIKTSRLDQEIHASLGTPQGDRVRVGSSVAVSSLLRRAAQEGWAGFEFLAGVPGSMGGVVVMNAGTHLGEAASRVEQVETFDFSSCQAQVWDRSEMSFEYRKNLFLPAAAIVTGATWRVERSDPSLVKKAIQETLDRRKSTQPIDYPSCGSVFKNPTGAGMRAWQVVDRLGLRGHRIGNAQFSEKHSNFIINLGGARAQDVRALIQIAQRRALEELGVRLEEEVRYLGF
ncbi:MAG: UDP-N-acetylmuramate dehydrogenase [Oligoflexia bacterium]|jgi:UDP-N-acetylmuramate dehydrogenase